MRRKTKELNTLLNKAIVNIREEQVDAALTDEARDRVWERISTEGRPAFIQQVASEQIESCADFQSLMPAFTRNELSPARALLLQDHTHECVPCRRALKEARTGRLRIALDVFETEPLPPDSPWLSIPGVVLSPHMAGPTFDQYPTCTRTALANIRRYLNQWPLEFVVTSGIYDRST